MPGDLHTHSSCSDGSTPIEKLPWLAACAGLDWLAISDHDTNRSVRYAYAHPEQNGVKLIPTVELTAYDYRREHRVHILCYYPDDCEALTRHTAVMDKRRYDAVYQSCKELEEICPQFKTEEALEFAKDSGTLYAVIVVTGVLGNILGEFVCKIFRITEPISKGLALGASSHAIGTAKAIEIGEIEGAMSSLAIAVAGILTVVFASVFANFY